MSPLMCSCGIDAHKEPPKMTHKIILDACCGGRQFWYQKHHPETLYIDIREEHKGCLPMQPNFEVKPDMIADFRDLKIFPNKKFKLIVWDPPHLKSLGATSIMHKKYGSINSDTWRYDLGKGFDELWRVLDDNGVLVFKWNEGSISLKDVLKCFKQVPLFGHPTSKSGKTHWCVFFKSHAPMSPGKIGLDEVGFDDEQLYLNPVAQRSASGDDEVRPLSEKSHALPKVSTNVVGRGGGDKMQNGANTSLGKSISSPSSPSHSPNCRGSKYYECQKKCDCECHK